MVSEFKRKFILSLTGVDREVSSLEQALYLRWIEFNESSHKSRKMSRKAKKATDFEVLLLNADFTQAELMQTLNSVKEIKDYVGKLSIFTKDDAEDKDFESFTETYDNQLNVFFNALSSSQPVIDYLKNLSSKYILIISEPIVLTEAVKRTVAELEDRKLWADLIYFDSDSIDENGLRQLPKFKPDYCHYLLHQTNFIGGVLIVSSRLINNVIDRLPDSDCECFCWSLAIEAGNGYFKKVHVPGIGYHSLRGSSKNQKKSKGHRVPDFLKTSLKRLNNNLGLRHFHDHSFSIRISGAAKFKISVIVPFRDKASLLRRCFESLESKKEASDVEYIFIDNQSTQSETFKMLKDLSSYENVKILRYDDFFNWSKINNFAFLKSQGDIIIFLNNDVYDFSNSWDKTIAALFGDENVGIVGSQLWDEDGSISHAGIALNLNSVADHLFRSAKIGDEGYLALNLLTREVTGVSGAFMATRRSHFESIGGLDPKFPLTFNDLDFCLRTWQANKLVLYCPLVQARHLEKSTRGEKNEAEECGIFLRKWAFALKQGDPYLNPNLSYLLNDFHLDY